MFSSRNIHFAILGLILGASAGYIYAFVEARADQTPPPLTASDAAAGAPQDHPAVSDDQLLAAMKEMVEADPTQPDVVSRYALALFDAGRFTESEEWFAKAVELAPTDVDTRSMYAAALWRMGKKDDAERELEAALKLDPQSVASLHGLAMLALEKHDARRAEEFIKRLESVEPAYDQLPELRSRLKAEQGGA